MLNRHIRAETAHLCWHAPSNCSGSCLAISRYVNNPCLMHATTDAGRRYVQTCVPIGTRVPHRHAVCRSYWLIYQGDKEKTAHFVTQENVPICADAGMGSDLPLFRSPTQRAAPTILLPAIEPCRPDWWRQSPVSRAAP